MIRNIPKLWIFVFVLDTVNGKIHFGSGGVWIDFFYAMSSFLDDAYDDTGFSHVY